MHIVIVIVTVRPELLAEFEQAALMNARTSVERDPGCRRFDVSQSYENPAVWIFHEVYDSPEAHARHRESPHFLAYDEVASRATVDKQVIRAAGKFVKA
jgi:autoinducer 2-degrading protein